MTAFGRMFAANGIGQQLLVWQVLAQLANPIMAPPIQALTAAAWRKDPNVPLSPPQAADMVARGHLTEPEGAASARDYGIAPSVFAQMVRAARSVPAVSEILEAYRRGLIGEGGATEGLASVEAGLTDLGIRPEWHRILVALAVENPTWTDALDAYLEGQIDEGTARTLFATFGGNPEYFTMLFNTRGEAPTPVQALEMARRGIIPWDGTGPGATSFRQAFLEGPWRNKWEPAFRALGEYLPPARTVTALLREGAIDKATAVDLLLKEGLTAQLANAYVSGATKAKTAAAKELTESQIMALHAAHILTDAQTAQHLEALKYTADEAALLVRLANVAKQSSQVTSAVARIRTLYAGHRLSKAAALASLAHLGIAPTQRDAAIQAWDVELAATVERLTTAQITAAWDLKIISESEAMSLLEAHGYHPRDAWIILSIKNGGKLPGEPAGVSE